MHGASGSSSIKAINIVDGISDISDNAFGFNTFGAVLGSSSFAINGIVDGSTSSIVSIIYIVDK